MPKVNLSKKVTDKILANIDKDKCNAAGISKSQFDAAVNYVVEYAETVMNTVVKVAITPFGFVGKNISHTTTYTIKGVSGGCKIDLTTESPGNVIFKRVGEIYFAALDKSAGIQTLLLTYIARHLVWGSNIIRFEVKDIAAKYDYSLRSITNAIEFACQNHIITRTNKRNVYIINHNALFYGRYDSFVNDYKQLYGNNTHPVFVNGKVDLNANYVKGDENDGND